MDRKERISLANAKAMDILLNAKPAWTDVCPAIECIPGMTPNLILVAGPPISPDQMPLPVKTSVCGAAVHEGLACTMEEAWDKVLAGEIKTAPAQDYSCGCGAAMATSASMPVIVCEDRKFGGKGFCAPHPGPSMNVLRWGFYNQEVEDGLVWFRDFYGPALGKAVRHLGGIDLVSILSRTAGMGDENHTRQPAASMLCALQLLPSLLDCEFEHKHRIIKEYTGNDRFFLHVMMAGVESVLCSVKGIPASTVMVGMGGNGVEFGLQFAGTGKQWFTAPAPMVEGLLLKPSYKMEDLIGFLGDSCVTELYGLGGMSAIAGPAFVILCGGTLEEARQRAEDARAVSLGEHTFAPIPWDGNRGFPVGVDMRKVVGLGIQPTSHAGGTLAVGGQGSVGSAKLPMECFKKALVALKETLQ